MKKYFFYPVIACILLMSCNKNEGNSNVEPARPIELTAKQAEKVSGDNSFAFRLFQQVATSDDSENAFISPLSVTMAMGMLYNGASGDARTEMAGALGMAGFTDEEINGYYQKMSQALLGIDPLTTLHIANSIWFRKDYTVKQNFFDINKKYYNAEVRGLDFTASPAVGTINNWCAKNTGNRIDKIIDAIPDNAIMYLINAVYFKSKWQAQFDKNDTKTAIFTLQNGTQTDVKMMEQTTNLAYYANDKLSCVEMPYGNQAFSMVAILPAEGKNPDTVIESLDSECWQLILAGMHTANVHLKFPRFKQECEYELNKPVAALGMNLIFQNGYLNGIADDPRLKVSSIKHTTFVEVNEERTEAAAVTSVGVNATSIGPTTPVPFYVDRPFIYLIRERSTGAILFIGRMDHPKEQATAALRAII
jgi:serpin B